MQSTQVRRRVALLPTLGLAGMIVGAALILLLQFLPPTDQLSPIRRTISEYALSSNKWIFNVAVLLVALGSAVGFAALIRQRRVAAFSAATLFCALWTVSLLVIVAYPKHNYALGPSSTGTVHRVASIVAFVCLPIAILLANRTAFAHSPLRRRWVMILAITSLLWFALILGAIGVSLAGNGPWWQLIPLGLIERLMALNGLLATGALVWPSRLDMPEVTDQAEQLRVLS
jgi:hypothetical protein